MAFGLELAESCVATELQLTGELNLRGAELTLFCNQYEFAFVSVPTLVALETVQQVAVDQTPFIPAIGKHTDRCI